MIAGNGLIFSGRGWDYVGGPLDGIDNSTEFISFGFITEKTPDKKSIEAFYSFLQQGNILEKVEDDFEISGDLELISSSD